MADLNFKKLLRKYADGEHFDADVVEAVEGLPEPSNGAPESVPTPSQEAVAGVVQGAMSPTFANPQQVNTQNAFVPSGDLGHGLTEEAMNQPMVNPQSMIPQGDTSDTRPRYFSEPSAEDKAKTNLEFAMNQPVEKQKWWKDFASKGAGVLAAAFAPQPGQKIQGWGAQKKDNDIRDAVEEMRVTGLVSDREQNKALRAAQIESVKAGTQKTLDQPNQFREKLRSQVEQEARRQAGRIAVIERQADIKSGEAKITTDQEGRKWKTYLKPDANGNLRDPEPVINPLTHEQEIEPGEQEVDWNDPLTGNTIKVKAKSVLMPGATIASGNANREQQAATFNAAQALSAQKDNVANLIQYNKSVASQIEARAKALGEVLSNGTEVQGYVQAIQQKGSELEGLTDEQDPDNKRRNKLLDDINTLQGKMTASLGKTKAGSEVLASMPKIALPQRIQSQAINASRVGGGITSGGKYSGQTFPSPSAIKGAFPGKSEKEIRALVEAQGGRFQ